MTDIVIRYAHFISILILTSMLVMQNVFVRERVSAGKVQLLAKIDAIYGISAVVIFITGLSLWLFVGKDKSFYSANPIFHVKLTLFVVIALISILPTIFFLKNRKAKLTEVVIPKYVLVTKRTELLLLVALPFLAVLMAQGIGL